MRVRVCSSSAPPSGGIAKALLRACSSTISGSASAASSIARGAWPPILRRMLLSTSCGVIVELLICHLLLWVSIPLLCACAGACIRLFLNAEAGCEVDTLWLESLLGFRPTLARLLWGSCASTLYDYCPHTLHIPHSFRIPLTRWRR